MAVIISFNNEIGEKNSLFISDCSILKKLKLEEVSHKTIQEEEFRNYFKKSGKRTAKAAKSMALKFANNPTRELQLPVDLSLAASAETPEAIAATVLSVLEFCNSNGEGCI